RTDRNWRAMGVSLAERYTGHRLRPMDNDLALGQGRIPLVDQPYGPYAKVDAAGYQMLFDYRGGYRRFRQISFSEIINRSELVVLVALVLGFGLVAGATAWGFGSAGLLLPGVPVALAWGLSAASCNFVMHSVGSRERTKLRRSFESYLDPRIISQMMQGDTLPSFGGEHREIT